MYLSSQGAVCIFAKIFVPFFLIFLYLQMEEADLKLNVDLCTEVKKHPCLYDSSCEDYLNRKVVERTWQEVAEKVGLTVKVCKRRWMNLRTVYVRRRSQTAGTVLKKRYYLNKYISFLNPHIKRHAAFAEAQREQSAKSKQRHSSESLQNTSNTNDDDAESEDLNKSQFIKEENVIDEQINALPIEPSTSQYSSNQAASQFDRSSQPYKKPRLNNDDENLRKSFLLSLLPEIDEMPEAQFRLFKRRVLGLIDELELPDPTAFYSNFTTDSVTEMSAGHADPLGWQH